MGQALGCGGGRKDRQDEEYEPQNSSSSEKPKPRRATAPRVELNWSTVFGINASDVGCGVDSDSEEECCREVILVTGSLTRADLDCCSDP